MIGADALIEKFRHALADKWGYIWGTAGVQWTQAKQTQKVNYMKSKYGDNWQKNVDAKDDTYYGAAMYGAKWIGHTVADCSGLFVWAFKQLGGSIYHGSNSIYDRYCTTKGKITDQIRKEMLPGTAVFVCKASGNKSHIGLYVGNNTVIEASGTQAGVCTSKLNTSKWTYYGLLKGVSYGGSEPVPAPAPEPKPAQKPTLRKGDKGDAVRELQTDLQQLGYGLGSYGVDGDFGRATMAAVQLFQHDHGLTVDGICGPKTWTAIEKALGEKPAKEPRYTVTICGLTDEKAREIVQKYGGVITAE